MQRLRSVARAVPRAPPSQPPSRLTGEGEEVAAERLGGAALDEREQHAERLEHQHHDHRQTKEGGVRHVEAGCNEGGSEGKGSDDMQAGWPEVRFNPAKFHSAIACTLSQCTASTMHLPRPCMGVR